LEKSKIPTVTIVTDQFLSLAQGTQQSQGFTDLAYAVVEHPIGMLQKNEVDAKVDRFFQTILDAALKWAPSKDAAIIQEKPYPAKTTTFKGTYAELNDLFTQRQWSLSLPIVPPTPEKVKAMLQGTKRKADEVVWVVPPRQGMLTVELVATLGVMAGSKPEHMPLLLAAVEAMKHPDVSWRGTSTTTAATVPVFILNGPMIEKLGLDSGTGVSGPLNPVTNALGYFANLVGDVVGGSVQPDLDKSTHGSTGDFVSLIYVENDKANPWRQSYAEEQGFKKTDSVLTYFGSYLGGANVDHTNTTGSGLLNTIALTLVGNAGGIASCLTDYDKPYSASNGTTFSFVFLCPEHAAQIQKEFPEKLKVKEYLVKEAALPYRWYAPSRCDVPADTKPDTWIPRYIKTDSIKLVVTGGPGKQSQVWSSFVQTSKPASVIVDY